jgi:hypothetical protein
VAKKFLEKLSFEVIFVAREGHKGPAIYENIEIERSFCGINSMKIIY